MSYLPVKEAAYALKAYYPNADQLEKTIINCALVAAGADAVGGIIPVFSIPATIIGCIGAVWVMYGKLCKQLGITLEKKVLKILARAALANIAGNLGGAIAALVAGMLIPGASILASAVVAFISVYLAGLVFLKLVLKLAKKSKNPYSFSDINTREMKQALKNTPVSKDDLDAAKQAYTDNKNE